MVHDAKIKEFAAATRPKNRDREKSASVNITGSGNTIVIGDNGRHIGQRVPIAEMTKDERRAYYAKEWDGVERRDPEANSEKDFEKQRASDIHEHALYYVAVFMCLIIIVVWPALAWKFGQ